MEELEILPELANELTPKVNGGASEEEKAKIKILLESWIQPRDIFIDYNFPLERAVEVENELKSLETPVVPVEEII